MAIASLILGIIGLAGLIPIIGWFFILINILAIIFGIIALFMQNEQKGMAIAGIITGAIPIIVKIMFYIVISITSVLGQF